MSSLFLSFIIIIILTFLTPLKSEWLMNTAQIENKEKLLGNVHIFSIKRLIATKGDEVWHTGVL